MIFRFFIMIFFINLNLLFSDVYTPQTTKEKKEINKFRTEKIVIGLLNDPFYNLSYPNISSLNNCIKDFLINYMKLDVQFKTISHKNLKSALREGEIDGVALIPKNVVYDDTLDFSDSIFSEKLYIVSQNKNITNLSDLNNEIIYAPFIEPYQNIADVILNNNDISSFIIPVDNLSNYKNRVILTTSPALYKTGNGIELSHSPGISIALNHEFKDLLPFINEALTKKYRSIFMNRVSNLNSHITHNNFYSSLTDEELEYLKNLSAIKVNYKAESNSIISYRSQLRNEYIGIVPSIFKRLKDTLNIDFIDVTETTSKSIDSLKNNEFDVMILSKTKARSKNFLFSKKIFEIKIYVVNLDNSPSSSRTIGVIKNTMEEQLAQRYDVPSNIFVYDDLPSLTRALDTGEVGNIFVIDQGTFDSNKYNIIPFETVPLNLAFNKDNYLLRNIIEKAFQYVINLNDINEIAILEKNIEDKQISIKNKEIRNIFILFSISFGIMLLAIIIYLYKESLNKKMLLSDSLTTLPNRFIFDEFCHTQNSLEGCTFVIDLNNFKNINDSLGHEFGDLILKEFASFLKNSFINSYIFRISGDEFYGFSFEDAQSIINKLSKFKDFCPTLLKHNITFNVGISDKSSKISLTESFRHSDLAMLETKKDKNNFYKIADTDFIEKMNRETSILSFLKDNVSGIYPVLQPKYSTMDQKLIGAEALARYNSKDFGAIGPFEFIPIAEKYGFIHKIDYKVAKDSIAFLSDLLSQNIPLNDFRLSFNISIKTFKRDDLIEVIKSLLSYYNVPGKYIEIEITESIFVLDMKDLITKLKSFKDLDIHISLDDFTAGHSTAGLLPLLPIDVVKFDKSLLDSIQINEKKGKIVYKNLTSLIKDLNFEVVAEGVETKEQLDFLKELDVDYIQGYYFSKPLSLSDFNTLLKKL
ncbi:MAG: EAL domain-containing protein [Cetobacterium sp.]